MTSNQFYSKPVDPGSRQVFLEGKEHHHLARVIRVKEGEEVWLFDDSGCRYRTVVEAITKDRTRLRIIQAYEQEEQKIRITLGQASLKPHSMDLIVQKTTELGLSVFAPLITARSRAGLRGEAEKKIDRWRKIAREAAKQSRRPDIPAIETFRPLAEFSRVDVQGKKIFLNESGGTYLRDILSRKPDQTAEPTGRPVTLLAGPEGGWTTEEKKMLEDRGYEPVSLGKTVLRAETAVIVAIGMISHFWN